MIYKSSTRFRHIKPFIIKFCFRLQSFTSKKILPTMYMGRIYIVVSILNNRISS